MLREHENSTDLRFGGPPRLYECNRSCLLFQLISVIPAFDPLYFGLSATRQDSNLRHVVPADILRIDYRKR